MNLDGLSIWMLSGIFIAGGVAIWISGIYLSNTVDALSKKFGLGQALGGMIVLAIVTNLPEIAITVSASLQNNIELAVGNILGGIAMQTVVMVVLDVFGLGKKASLTYKASSMQLVLEGLLVLFILIFVVMGHQLPSSLVFLRMSPAVILIFLGWVAGLVLINKARNGLPWQAKNSTDDDKGNNDQNSKNDTQKRSTGANVAIFLTTALVTLVAGYFLERSGDAIAKQIGMQGVIFGATILAAATSLPEVSTGLASIKLKAYTLAVSDIFGGNAFLPVLFLVATLISGKAILPGAHKSDIYLTCLGMLLTSVYVWGMIFKPKKQFLGMGIDSFIVLILYLFGVAGLFAVG
ncbi:MAG: sodium:calcium antiporter [Ginsengibacter sp.]